MSPKRGGIAVKVFTPAGDCVLGQLTWNEIGPHITLESGELFSGETKDYSYEVYNEIVVDETGFSKHIPLKKAARIMLKPIEVTKRPYSARVEQLSDDLYPPVSHGWTASMRKKGEEALVMSLALEALNPDALVHLALIYDKTGRSEDAGSLWRPPH